MCACCGINQMHITELTLSLVNGFARCFGYSTQLFAISVPLTYDPLSHLISSHLMRWHFYIHYSGTQKITTMKTAKHNKVTNTNGHTTIWILIFFHFFLFQLFSWNFCLLSIFVVILVVATTFAILIKKKKRLLDEISAFYSFFFILFSIFSDRRIFEEINWKTIVAMVCLRTAISFNAHSINSMGLHLFTMAHLCVCILPTKFHTLVLLDGSIWIIYDFNLSTAHANATQKGLFWPTKRFNLKD